MVHIEKGLKLTKYVKKVITKLTQITILCYCKGEKRWGRKL